MENINYGTVPADIYLAFPETRNSAAFHLPLLRKGDVVESLQGEQRFSIGSNRLQSEGWLWIHSGQYSQKFGHHPINISKWSFGKGKIHDGVVEWRYSPEEQALAISTRLYKLNMRSGGAAVEGKVKVYWSVLADA